MENLSLNYTAIGSLPLKSGGAPKEAVEFIFEHFAQIPFLPQLPHYDRHDDMILQFCNKIAGLKCVEEGKYVFNPEDDEFYAQLEELFVDYETVLAADTLDEVADLLDKYGGFKNDETFKLFLEHLEKTQPKYVKSSVTGPFTFATSLQDQMQKCAFYDDTLRDVALKSLVLKALWQMKEFKKVAPNALPIIFMDEPSISQIGSCAFLTVKNPDVVDVLRELSDAIKKFGGISAIHCCGKTDWDISFKSNVDIINFDAFFYAESLATFAKSVDEFLKRGGMLAFGVIPTLDKDALQTIDAEGAVLKFEEALKYLTDKNIDKQLILKQTIITPSCGCGSLSVEEAKKALSLTRELSLALKEKYGAVL
ncbi:conserved uncharacterized protein [Candidatus Gastranaerophilus sp. (ex Termes propinquus)]|nr:conserved uncharacterized protein [Candidatus Gastranaerophilus sp. (ex Termes propinquus)]